MIVTKTFETRDSKGNERILIVNQDLDPWKHPNIPWRYLNEHIVGIDKTINELVVY